MTALPHKLYRAVQLRELDRLAIEDYAIPGVTLMERAGAAAFDLLQTRWPQARRIVVLCGGGNNGGDGFVVARLAALHGLDVRVLQLGDARRLRGDALEVFRRMQQAGPQAGPFVAEVLSDADVIVDALIGTGLARQVQGEFRQVIDDINRTARNSDAAVLALDIPSGLCADSGCALGAAVEADATMTFIGLKQGMLTGSGPDYCGDIFFNDLELPAAVYESCRANASRIDYDVLAHRLHARRRASHKGHHGHVLVIGGDHGMSGAVRLAAEAAARSGSGLVSIATRGAHAAMISAVRPELMAHGVEDAAALKPLLARANVIAIGPGLGGSDWSRRMLAVALDADRPLVVDADALNLLAAEPLQREDWVLTPHPGEAGRLLGTAVTQVQQDRFASVRLLQQRYGGHCVLKGAGTLLSDASGDIALCSEGNPGMACGGMGDVLTGIIAALRAQHLDSGVAARLGVCLHARAADIAAGKQQRGLMATDLMPVIRQLANPSV